MTPELLLSTGIVPALTYLRGHGIPDVLAARRFMLAIAMQESGLRHRRQVGQDGTESGPAASFAQFEKNGGCKGVLTHRGVKDIMLKACADFNLTPTPEGLWEAMRYNDVVAGIAWRLLIYTLPKSLPQNPEEGWGQYLSAWRPGKPHPEKWPTIWSAAELIVKANP